MEDNGSIIERNSIWIESRCENASENNNSLCSFCLTRPKEHSRYQATKFFQHGEVGGPYPKNSKIYGSAYYLKFIKQGWKIKESDERRAKEAQQNSIMGKKATAVSTPAVSTPVGSTHAVSTPAVSTPNSTRSKVTKVKSIRVKKKTTTELSSSSHGLTAQFVESTSPPIIPEEIIVVKVKKIRCEGSDYYLDSNSGKMYGVLSGGVGKYKGRYCQEEDHIDTTYPDSDAE